MVNAGRNCRGRRVGLNFLQAVPMQRDEDRTGEMHAFLASSGWGDADLSPLPGDASTRRYIRLSRNRHRAMLMDQPQSAEQPPCPPDATPDQRHALGYNAVARLAGADCGRFIAAADFLRSLGISAPDVYASDITKGFVVIEDLGDNLFADALATGGDEQLLYSGAVDALARLQHDLAPEKLTPDRALYAYDETALTAEIDLMTEWFMPVALGRAASGNETSEHRALWRETLRTVLNSPRVFVHRDYHAQNLFWLPDRRGVSRVGVIDFQDAVAGTKSYDLISLLEDARRDVPLELAEAMTERYLDAIDRNGGGIDREAARAEMAVMAAQRNAKIA